MAKSQRKIWFGVSLVFSLVSILCLLPSAARAGFGISPPYVRNENLTQGSHFEQKIILVRDKPDEDWEAELIFNVPEANDWFSVDKGTKFILPKGEKQTPIIFSVDVPPKAKFKRYKGFIRVKTAPLKVQELGTVAITLGGQIDVDLNVTKEIFDFKVKGIKVSDLEEGHKWLFLYFPGIIRFSIQIENIGNIDAVPSKVHFDIYDSKEKKLLESVETKKFDKKVKPFETEWVLAKLPTRLKPGSYWAQYKIYKKEEVVSQGKIHLSILPKGSIPGYQGAGLLDLSLKDKFEIVLIVLVILVALAGLGYGGYWGVQYRKKYQKKYQKKRKKVI